MLDITYHLKDPSDRLSKQLDEDTIKIVSEVQRRQLRGDGSLPFGALRSDHMFLMNYNRDRGWHSPRIVPYEPIGRHINMMPCSDEYCQRIFEGAKAFMHPDGELYVFRFDENAKRFNTSIDIVNEGTQKVKYGPEKYQKIPNIPVEDQIQALHALLDVDRLWYPVQEGASVYIRPKIAALSDGCGVSVADDFWFSICLMPSGPYFDGGFDRLTTFMITEHFKRVTEGSGKAKWSGHYGNSLKAINYAKSWGADQVLFLDPTNEWIEEAGSNNHWQFDDKVRIPTFTDNILESITSRSIIRLAELGYLEVEVVQEMLAVKGFVDGLRSGKISEAGGFGTAASVAPGKYMLEGGKIIEPRAGVGEVSRHLFEVYTGIQRGLIEAPEGWLEKVERAA